MRRRLPVVCQGGLPELCPTLPPWPVSVDLVFESRPARPSLRRSAHRRRHARQRAPPIQMWPHVPRAPLVLSGLPRRPRRTQWALTSHRRGRQRPRRPLQPHRPPRRHPLPRSRLQPPHMQTPAHKFPSARTPPLVMAAGVAMRLIPAPLVAFAPASCGLVQWPRRCCLRMVASRPSFAGCGLSMIVVVSSVCTKGRCFRRSTPNV